MEKTLDILDPELMPQKNGHTSLFSQATNRTEGTSIGTVERIKKTLPSFIQEHARGEKQKCNAQELYQIPFLKKWENWNFFC